MLLIFRLVKLARTKAKTFRDWKNTNWFEEKLSSKTIHQSYLKKNIRKENVILVSKIRSITNSWRLIYSIDSPKFIQISRLTRYVNNVDLNETYTIDFSKFTKVSQDNSKLLR